MSRSQLVTASVGANFLLHFTTFTINNMREVTFVMPVYGNSGQARAAVATVREFLPDVTIFIVDDASPEDVDRVALRRLALDHNAEYRRMPENVGQSGAINAGVSFAGTPYVVIMDNDVTLYGNEWLHDHIGILNRDARIVAVSGCSNPDFKDDHAETYHYADACCESAYCEFPASGILTLKTSTAREFPFPVGHPGMWPDSIWEVGLIRAGRVMYTSKAAAHHHDNTNHYQGSHYRQDCIAYLAEYGKDVLKPRRSRQEVRHFMTNGEWPCSQ